MKNVEDEVTRKGLVYDQKNNNEKEDTRKQGIQEKAAKMITTKAKRP